MDIRTALLAFYDVEDLDMAAKVFGYSDMAQMEYYENRQDTMTDSEVDALAEREFLLTVQQLPSPPPTIFVRSEQLHELESVDCREVYGEDMSLAGVY